MFLIVRYHDRLHCKSMRMWFVIPYYHMTTLVGIVQRAWSRLWANMWLVTPLSFFSFFLFRYLFLSLLLPSARNPPFREQSGRSIGPTPKRVLPAKDVPFGGLDNIWLHLRGQTPEKNLPKWAAIGISRPNRRSRKISTSVIDEHSLSASNFTYSLRAANAVEKAKYFTWGPEGVTWPTFRILELPLYLGDGWR